MTLGFPVEIQGLLSLYWQSFLSHMHLPIGQYSVTTCALTHLRTPYLVVVFWRITFNDIIYLAVKITYCTVGKDK